MNKIKKLRINCIISIIAYMIYTILAGITMYHIGRFSSTYLGMSVVLGVLFISSINDLEKYREFLHDEESHKYKRDTKLEKIYLTSYTIGSFLVMCVYLGVYLILLYKHIKFYNIASIIVAIAVTLINTMLFANIIKLAHSSFKIISMEEKSWEE